MPDIPSIAADDFVRRFSMRRGNLMWFLGAGASATAGIPTAWHMIWEFKQQLFISQRKISKNLVADLSNPAVRQKIQDHIDSSDRLPPNDSSDEYAGLFEAVYPAEADRRAYLDSKISGAKPSYGHLALAALMRAQVARLVWTTNFDPLVNDACARIFSTTGALTSVDLDASGKAAQVIADGRWPLQIKLHGDFRSRRLKNTSDELRHQDAHLRKVLVDSCNRFGMIVAGYSGRDDSIMDALEQAAQEEGAFPSGLFWLNRGPDPPRERVTRLLSLASENGIEAALVSIESFDEVLRDLVRILGDIKTAGLDEFERERRRWSPPPRPTLRGGWPIIRLNALPVTPPTVCRRIVCNIGGYAEIRELLTASNLDIPFGRSHHGVLTYGRDVDLRRVFEPHGITHFDLHTIDTKRLRYESAEQGLLREALTQAIARVLDLESTHRRSANLLAPKDPNAPRWSPLRQLVKKLDGSVPDSKGLSWREGLAVRLDWARDQLWLLYEPRTVFDGLNEENKNTATSFARERTVRRYNSQLEQILSFWTDLMAKEGSELKTLGIGDGIDATFTLSADRAFSGRGQA